MKNRIYIISFLIAFSLIVAPLNVLALGEGQFKPIATGGFGDSANSYSWGLAAFNGDVYASTVRHHLWSVAQGLSGLLPVEIPIEYDIPGPDNPTWGSEGYAQAMRGEIWRYKEGQWTRVHQSDIYHLYAPIDVPQYGITIPLGDYPTAYGYRTLGNFNGHIYALGVGTWMPPMPRSSIVRSATGNSGDWTDVTGEELKTTTNVRGFVEWNEKVYVSASKPGPAGQAGAGGCVVYGSSDGDGTDWEQVSEIGFGNPNNVEIYYITVFNDHLYASTVNYVSGFEVWKTDGTPTPAEDDGNKYIWTQVVKDGFGDTWNQYGMTMQAFGDYLYVGSAVGIGMVLKDGQPAGTRALDIIRIDKDDNAELVVGAYFPSDPPSGWPTFRVPLSFMPAGFGNPFNVYTWHMTVHKDWLVAGTLDLSGTLLSALKDLLLNNPAAAIQMIQSLNFNGSLFSPSQMQILNKLNLEDEQQAKAASNIIDFIIAEYGGADLWKTKDGVKWEPVTLSGFKNSLNYGIRRTVSIPDADGKDHLYIGTANPFTGMENGGCEVLMTPPIKLKGPKNK